MHTLIGDTGEVQVLWHTGPRPAHLWLGGYGVSVSHGTSPGTTTGVVVSVIQNSDASTTIMIAFS